VVALGVAPRSRLAMDDESGKNKALGVVGLALAAGQRVAMSVRALHTKSAPWSLAFHPRAISAPLGVGDALHRLRRNANDFGYNYTLILGAVASVAVLAKPFSLVVLFALATLWGYVLSVRAADVVCRGATFNLRAQAAILFCFSFLVLYLFTDVASTLACWLGGGALLCAAHAVFRTPEPRAEGDEEAGFVGALMEGGRSVAGAIGRVGDIVPAEWRAGVGKMMS